MTMHNPSHPGASLRHCLEDSDLTANDLARELHISRSKLFRVLRGARNITAELALRPMTWPRHAASWKPRKRFRTPSRGRRRPFR